MTEVAPGPCRSCGSQQDISIITASSLLGYEVFAVCFQCAAAGPVYYADDIKGEEHDEAEARAVTGWNEEGPQGRRPDLVHLFAGYEEDDSE